MNIARSVQECNNIASECGQATTIDGEMANEI